MQERQVTIGHDTHRVPQPFLVLATQNPIESEGTYPLPEAQVDRFMFKLVVDYPDAPRRGRGRRALARQRRRACARCSRPSRWRATSAPRSAVYVDRRVMEYAVALTTATREPTARRTGSSSAPARAARSTWSTPGARWRCCAGATTCCPSDVRDLARDVLRHRIVLTYEALAAGVDADRVLDDVLERRARCRASSSRTSASERIRADVSFREPLAAARRWRSSRWRSLAYVARAAAAHGATPSATRTSTCWPRVAGRSWGRHVPAAARAAGAGRAADRARRARSARSRPSSARRS